MKVNRAPNIMVNNINNFPDMMFPVMWLEEVSTKFFRIVNSKKNCIQGVNIVA